MWIFYPTFALTDEIQRVYKVVCNHTGTWVLPWGVVHGGGVNINM